MFCCVWLRAVLQAGDSLSNYFASQDSLPGGHDLGRRKDSDRACLQPEQLKAFVRKAEASAAGASTSHAQGPISSKGCAGKGPALGLPTAR